MPSLAVTALAALLLVLAACSASPQAPSRAAAQRAAPAVAQAAPTAAVAPAAPATAAIPAAAATPGAGAAATADDDRAVAAFYQGKTIRIVVAYTAGGAFDVIARMLARVLPQYIPGRPNVIVENKPGAAGILATNTVYAAEPKDGTVIIMPGENLVLLQAVGAAGVEFDARKLNWLAGSSRSPYGCLVRLDSGITSILEVIGGKEAVLAATSPGTGLYDTGAILNGTLGTNFKLVPGYGGAADMRLAMDRKEVDGTCNNLESMLSLDRPKLEGDTAYARVLVMLGAETPDYPFLKGVPAAETLAKTDEARQLLRAVNGPSLMGRPFAMAPGVPPARVATLRQAFAAALADPQFLAEADHAGFKTSAVSGEEVTRIVDEIQSTPPALLARLKEILQY